MILLSNKFHSSLIRFNFFVVRKTLVLVDFFLYRWKHLTILAEFFSLQKTDELTLIDYIFA